MVPQANQAKQRYTLTSSDGFLLSKLIMPFGRSILAYANDPSLTMSIQRFENNAEEAGGGGVRNLRPVGLPVYQQVSESNKRVYGGGRGGEGVGMGAAGEGRKWQVKREGSSHTFSTDCRSRRILVLLKTRSGQGVVARLDLLQDT